MKKTLFYFATMAAMTGITGTATAAGTLGTYDVQVSATVIESSTCVVNAPSSLVFDNIKADQVMDVVKGPAHAQVYLIQMSGCRQGQHVSATVEGTADANNSQLLSTESDSGQAAKNVALAFFEQVGNNLHPLVPINTGSTTSRMINELGQAQIAIQTDVVLSDNTKPALSGTIAANANVAINFL